MFDSIAPPPASRRRKMFFAASGVVHGAAVVALIAGAMWRVDKLEYERQHAALSVVPPPPAGSSGAKKAAKLPDATVPKVPPKIKIHTPVQPVHVTTEPTPAETSTSTTPGDSDTDGPDTGIPTIGAGCIEGTNCGVSDSTIQPPVIKPCTDPSRVNDADCKPKEPPRIVIVENLRTSGETQIQPSDDVKLRMDREGQSHLHVSFKVCLDEHGAVTSTSRMGSTGYSSYDDALAAAIGTWRYRPYSVNGTAIPVCGPVTFTFTLTR